MRPEVSIIITDYVLTKPTCKSDLIRNSFFYKSINDWNSLDQSIVNAVSVDIFKDRLSATYKQGIAEASTKTGARGHSQPTAENKTKA